MRFTLERVSEPDIEPVTLAEMRRHLRCIDGVTDEDDDIVGLIKGARQWVEQFTGRALIDQAWRLSIDHDDYLPPGAAAAFASGVAQWVRPGELLLRRSPVLAITNFVSVDSEGTETEIDAESYEIREPDSKWPRVVALNGATWASGAFRITFRAGYAERVTSPQDGPEVVPVAFKQAMKLWVEAQYDRDQIMMPLLMKTAEQLIKGEQIGMRLA